MRISLKHLLPLCLALALVAGCAKGNGIRLTYALATPHSACAGDVIVFQFEDNRPKSDLGWDNDRAPITTVSNVADWVGWALFDELEAAGCQVKYRTSTVAPGDNLFVTGEILAVELNQTGTTTYEGKVTVRITATRSGETLLAQKYSSQVEDVAVPGYGTTSDIMAEALRGIMSEAVPAISDVSR